jgi:hypothetical protein
LICCYKFCSWDAEDTVGQTKIAAMTEDKKKWIIHRWTELLVWNHRHSHVCLLLNSMQPHKHKINQDTNTNLPGPNHRIEHQMTQFSNIQNGLLIKCNYLKKKNLKSTFTSLKNYLQVNWNYLPFFSSHLSEETFSSKVMLLWIKNRELLSFSSKNYNKVNIWTSIDHLNLRKLPWIN